MGLRWNSILIRIDSSCELARTRLSHIRAESISVLINKRRLLLATIPLCSKMSFGTNVTSFPTVSGSLRRLSSALRTTRAFRYSAW